jgi:hypothetical protein
MFRDYFVLSIDEAILIRSLCQEFQIFIPAKVEILDENCFSGCPSLEEVIFTANSHLREIRGRAFSDSSVKTFSNSQ